MTSTDNAEKKKMIRCRNCRREIFLTRCDGWYHSGNASTACRPGDGNPNRRAEP